MKKALIIGINDYPNAPLHSCVNDAISIANILETDGDGTPNFEVRLLTSKNNNVVTSEILIGAIENLFKGDAETALLFFAGHGIINEATNAGYIVSQDGKKGAWGVALSDILHMANMAYPKIKSTVIILDSCNSGFIGEIQAIGNSDISAIGNGVTILTACHREGTASENLGHGLFTKLLLDALNGSAANICGQITPASVYSHIDQILGLWEQRPIYKANVQRFVTLRRVNPKVSLDILRRLPTYFLNPTDEFKLDPSFEPDRENIPVNLRHIPINEKNTRIFKELQMCNRHGLVVPVNVDHMYYAAIQSTACKLTDLGIHYWNLAVMKRI